MTTPKPRFPKLGPEQTLTPHAVKQARLVGFLQGACPLCDSHDAGTQPIPNAEAAWWICAVCQRFSITTAAHATLKRMNDTRHARYGRIRTGLSRRCAGSIGPVAIDTETMITLADEGLAMADDSRE